MSRFALRKIKDTILEMEMYAEITQSEYTYLIRTLNRMEVTE